MNNDSKTFRLSLTVATLLVLLAGRTAAGASATLVTEGLESDGSLKLMVNKSTSLTTKTPYKRVNVGSPEVVEYNTLNPSTLLVTAKKPGTTQIILWDDQEKMQSIDVVVSADLKALEAQLKVMFPNSPIEVSTTNGTVVLRGRMPSLTASEQALAVASPYGAKVMNLLEIGGGQQVMLQVRFAEISRGVKSQLGISFDGSDGVSKLASTVGPTSGTAIFGNGQVGAVAFDYFIDALRSNNLLRMLAEPNLIAISGEEASFLAGGEFPVPVPQSGSGGGTTITIEYREFGVKLNFTPVVMGDGKIRLKVSPEVSELDFSTAVKFDGFITPGVTKRKVQTVVELNEGQTFAIAGLLSNTVNASKQVTPILGDIPVLGELFRSTRYERKETELVVLVTPRLVEGMNPAQVPALPGEKWRHPSEAELLLMRDLGGPELAAKPATEPMPAFKGQVGVAPATPTTDEK